MRFLKITTENCVMPRGVKPTDLKNARVVNFKEKLEDGTYSAVKAKWTMKGTKYWDRGVPPRIAADAAVAPAPKTATPKATATAKTDDTTPAKRRGRAPADPNGLVALASKIERLVALIPALRDRLAAAEKEYAEANKELQAKLPKLPVKV